VGGVKAKVLAAHREKLKHLILPRANERDVKKDIPESVARSMQFTFVDRLGQVFAAAMEPASKEAKKNSHKAEAGPAVSAGGR
jgi:ATP-dependent Lon protease